MIKIIKKIHKSNISIWLNENDIEVSFSGDHLDTNIVEYVKSNKKEIIDFLDSKM